MSPVEEIKTRLDIVDFINSHVPLKRAGANFAARCPFHNEKTPSFTVSRAKQLWYCFGACSEGGDIFKFLMKMEGLEFPEALKILADKAGVELPRYDKQAESRKNTLLAVLKAAQEFYAAQLRQPSGADARAYLKKRGLADEVINSFGLGYAPDGWDALSKALRDKFKAEDLFAAGLTVARTAHSSQRTADSSQQSAVSRHYDRFRHRIMFPIRDVYGNTVGFTSRLLDESRKEGKYVNTPETPVFSKSRVLYGIDLARDSIRKADWAVLAEGNMDVIACHQFGMRNVVAVSGTALTLDQVRLLKRYTGNLKIAFDADRAGENAAKRGIDLALQEGLRIKVITIPGGCGKDPDECIRKDRKIWEAAVRDAQEIMDYYLADSLKRFDIKTAHGRSQFVNTLLADITKLPDLVEQDFWLKKVGEMAQVEEKLLWEQMGKIRNSKLEIRNLAETKDTAAANRKNPERSRAEQLSERLLALFLAAPECADQIIGGVLPEMLTPVTHQNLYTKLAVCYTVYNSQFGSSSSKDPSFRQFWRDWAAKEAPDSLSTADILEMRVDSEFHEWPTSQFTQEAHFLVTALRREHLKEALRALAQLMKEAESAGDRARVAALTREFETLRAQEMK